MKSTIRAFLLSCLLLTAIFSFAAPMATADSVFKACTPGSPTDSSPACQKSSESMTSNSFLGQNGVITKVATILTTVVAVASVIMVIVGGLKYVLSSGDANNITSAKNTILYALIGLVISIIARAIITFVLKKL